MAPKPPKPVAPADPADVIRLALRALRELSNTSYISSIRNWEMSRIVAGRPDPEIVTEAEAALVGWLMESGEPQVKS